MRGRLGDGTAAFVEECRYADGTNVLRSAMLEHRDDRIVRLVGVRARDE